jgi:uncharacterized protein (DUF1697 family)
MRYVALLRGVNVGGNKMIAMADLRRELAAIGLDNVATLLQSGNVVFDAPKGAPAALEGRLEKEIEKRIGLQVDFHVRSAAEWAAIVAANPFPAEAKKDPGHLLVTVFKTPLEKGRVRALQDAIKGPERLHAEGRHLYMIYPDGIGNSKAAPLAERLLAARGTGRNWNTVLKLAALAAVPAE